MRQFALLAAVAAFALPQLAAPDEALAQAYLMDNPPPRAERSGQRVIRQPVMHTGSVASAPAPGAYGGGFIELLMTGRDPTPYVRPGMDPALAARPQAAPVRRQAQPEPSMPALFDDPMQPQVAAPTPRRTAALAPHDPMEQRGIGRVLDPRFERQEVAYSGGHAAGTVVIDTSEKFLYLVQGNGRALRYGIGVGRPGFEWKGAKTVTRKSEWPDWRPPAQMLKRRPDLPRFMAGGEDNPLGARALYLGSSLYRIHGTNEPHTIGQAVSSGCFRMTNDDVTDLYNRVRVGARVIVM
jgi:lipoprotein-anchoring transpeptidase ErfK/SrfK